MGIYRLLWRRIYGRNGKDFEPQQDGAPARLTAPVVRWREHHC